MRKVLLIFTILFIIILSTAVSADESKSYISTFFADKNVSMNIVDSNNINALDKVTVDNGNGTYTTYFFNQNVKYVDEEGNVIEKNISIEENTNIETVSNGYPLKVTANDIMTYFPAFLHTKGILIDELEFRLLVQEADLTGAAKYQVNYSDILEGVDLRFKSLLDGCLGEIESDDINKLSEVKFEIICSEYNISESDGKIIISNSQGNTYNLCASKLTNQNGNIIGNTFFILNDDGTVELSYDLFDGISLPTDSLTSVETSFSITKLSNNTASIETATVYSYPLFDINDSFSYCGTFNDGTRNIVARSFIKFDLSYLNNVDYANVISSKYYTLGTFLDSEDISEMYMVNEPWEKETINWYNRPDYYSNYKLYKQSMKDNYEDAVTSVRSFYITSAVQAWMQGMTNNGLMIKAENDEGWFGLHATNNYHRDVGFSVTYYVENETISGNGIGNGNICYLINKNSKMALSATTLEVDSNVYQKKFSMNENQQWRLIYAESVDDIDYYLIKTEPLNYFLKSNSSVVYNDSVKLVLSGRTDATLWQIKRNWDGSYKIIPKTSNNTLALSVYEASMDDNAMVVLGDSTVDFSKEDDWTLIPVDRENATLYGGDKDNGTSIDAWQEIFTVETMLNESSYNCFSNFPDIEGEEEINISASDYINRMFDSQIWYSHDHGGKSRIYFYNKIDNDVEMTAIGPYATREPEDESEETTAVWVNVSGIAEQNENLNMLQLAIINACSTGADDGNNNLVGLMYKLGTHCIISYTKNIEEASTKAWYEFFNSALYNSDVEFALRFADRMTNSGAIDVDAKHILGDTSIFYNYEANAEITEVLSVSNDVNTLDAVLSMEENIKTITIADNQETLILDNVSSSEDTANGYNTYWGSDGNLYGYYSDNELYFYAMNHRTDKYGNTVVNKSKVMEVAIDFLYDVGYGGGNYDYSCSNNYSKEFIIDFMPSSEAVVEGLLNIRMILENDSNGNPKVTFFKANRD